MLFNSFAFAVFLPIVFFAYWRLRGRQLAVQNTFLLVASYVFYGWWDPLFLSLIVISTAVDYAVGISLGRVESPLARKLLLGASLAANLGILGFFKYFDFFVDSLRTALATVGVSVETGTLDIILPVGISFYTFQTLSYTIDVYSRRFAPTKDLVAFAAYVSFFPQLVAGPIERARHLLPQFTKSRIFDAARARDGLRQMLWGFTKKVLVADNLARHVDNVFGAYAGLDGLHIVIGTFLFAIQIYCDFSGYSDIAIGCARLFGFDLMRNFAFPYFARDISEFWTRWHISLSTWFRDYLYIPLGGSRVGRARQLANVLIVCVVGGLWHGATWTFVIWGALHGIYYLPLVILRTHKKHQSYDHRAQWMPSVRDGMRMLATFVLVLIAWVFFRAESVGDAIGIFTRALEHPLGAGGYGHYLKPIGLSLVLLGAEWLGRSREHALDIRTWPRPVRWLTYYVLVFLILWKGDFGHVPFIYFQF